MPKIRYVAKRFGSASRAMIDQANNIIAEYTAQGFDLTLRQLFYQFVSRDLIRNSVAEYKRLGNVINDARLAGLIDWDHITDRTRNLRSQSHWDSPADIIEACAQSFRLDRWKNQVYRPEVWIEKDALVGVLDSCCPALDVPYFSCRGYTSQSEMWSASQRLRGYAKRGQIPIIIHLGDHDPSGIDMTRDIYDRLRLFMGGIEVKRIALNMDQVEEYNPPPNPAKLSDTRAEGYINRFGDESWELDALDPATLARLITDTVENLQDKEAWEGTAMREESMKSLLASAAGNWDMLVEVLRERKDEE